MYEKEKEEEEGEEEREGEEFFPLLTQSRLKNKMNCIVSEFMRKSRMTILIYSQCFKQYSRHERTL